MKTNTANIKINSVESIFITPAAVRLSACRKGTFY